MSRGSPFARSASWVDTAGFALIAASVGAWRLQLNSLGNTYYTAAAKTGAHSLRALFFATFDPTGIMAVDKPPLGLVGPALAIRLFGLSTWSVLLPQVLFFVVGVAVVHRAVRRWSTRRAAALAAAIVICTPAEVAVARSNNPDELLVLLTIIGIVLLGEAVRRDHIGWTVAAALTVGLAFTTKQLQAIVATPAAVAGLVLLSRGTWQRKAVRAAVYSIVVVASSAAWIVAVDSVTPSQRPYVANSVDDSERDLALGFNGAHRIEQLRTTTKARSEKAPPSALSGASAPSAPTSSATPSTSTASSATPRPATEPRRDLAAGVFVTQGTWLLVASTAAGLFALALRQVRPARELALLLGWTAVHAIVLAYAPGKFSPYYVAPLVPGVAIVTAIAVDSFTPRLSTRERSPGTVDAHLEGLVVLLATLATVAVTTISDAALRDTTLVAAAGALVSAAIARRREHRTTPGRTAVVPSAMTVALTTGAMLLVPLRWTYADVTHPQNTVAPLATLTRSGVSEQEREIRRNDGRLLRWVEARKPMPLTLATTRIAVSSAAILDGAAPAPLGGFFGTDARPSLATFQQWLRRRRLRWVAVPDLPPLHVGNDLPPAIVAAPWGPWTRVNCTRVPNRTWGGLDDAAFWRRYDHAPYHTPLALYDCAHASATTTAATTTTTTTATGHHA